MKKIQFISILTFLIYSFVNILSIKAFPFVHSDETWLAGLSKTIHDSGTFQVTEPFFTLYPRQPHAIKSLFHRIQGLWMSLWGYDITSVRSLSLIASLLALLFVYIYFTFIMSKHKPEKQLSQYKYNSFPLLDSLPLISVSLMAVSVQYIYASHFGRQESFILLFLVLTYVLVDLKVVHQQAKTSVYAAFAAAIITGVSIGFHPNSFLIACVIGAMLLYDAILNKRIRNVLAYVVPTGLIASIYIFVSMLWNRNFISDYNTFGDSLGASSGIVEKLQTFPLFIYKLYHQISGTYFTPDIRMEMIVFVILATLSASLLVSRWLSRRIHTPRIALPLLSSLGLTAGLILIGRYNATSIVFYLPLMSFMVFGLVHTLTEHVDVKTIGLLITITLAITGLLGYKTVRIAGQPTHEDYDAYINEIGNNIALNAYSDTDDGKEAKVLANLNAGFAFEPDEFLDYRDLGCLNDRGMTIETYLNQNNIKFIVLAEEMDYIFRNQDRWDILYGDMSYYPELLKIIERDFIPVHTFESPRYGMRIPIYNDGYPWEVNIYKRNDSLN